MAALSILFLTPLLSSLLPSSAQVIVSTSSKPPLLLLLPPTSYTPYPAGGDDGTVREDRLAADRDGTNEVPQEPRTALSHVRSTASVLSTLSTRNLGGGGGGGGPLLTQPTASKPRSDTAGLAFSRATSPRPAVTSTTPSSTTPSSGVTDPAAAAGGDPVTAAPGGSEDRGPLPQKEEGGEGSGSDPVPTVMRAEPGGSPDPPPREEEETLGTEMARFQPQAQPAPSEGPSLKMAEAQTPTALSLTVKPSPSALTRDGTTTYTPSPPPPPPETKATFNPAAATQTTAQAGVLTGELTANTRATDTTTPRQESTTSTVEPSTTTSSTTPTSSEEKTSVTSPNHSDPKPNTTTTTTRGATTTPATYVNITLQPTAVRTSPGTTQQPANATQPGGTTTTTTAAQSAKTGNTPSRTTTTTSTMVVPVGRGGHGDSFQPGVVVTQKNRSVPLGRPPASVTPPTPTPSPTPLPSPNGTLLHWDDLSRTLAFAWELHVYGSASLFLLLFAGAALGLALSPGMNCPHRGALALANTLLFLAGGLRAALFLIDPYGARHLMPRPAVTALYNLPLHLLVWTQAALALLSLRVVEVSALPPTLERPPLVAVLAVLQCTLLLAADLLSPALSPAVPVTLQVLSLCWGLAVCLGFLCYVFPRLRGPPTATAVAAGAGSAAPADETEGIKPWSRGRRTGLILGRVLAVCALLGALCCGLHVHATLWLYGLLGEWRRFNWGWWLVHFWARLLELAWGFSLLLLGSWVFWRPSGGPGSEEGGSGDSRSGGELPSPGQSAASSHRHTCWSKIVQSLTGKPCKKSESNGVGGAGGSGGAGGGTGEMPPNNWAGLHERPPGADISKSLIRNQNNHEQHVKDSNHGRNQRARSTDRGLFSDGSTGSLLRLQALGRPPQLGLEQQDKDLTDPSSLSLYEFDLRPPSPIDLGRSIDDALHREHLLGAGSLFQPLSLGPSSPYPPSPGYGSGGGQGNGPWLRRNSDPQLLSDSSDAPTESSVPLGGGSVMSSVPSRQVTAPPTPSHQGGHRWEGSVPSSVSCPVSLRPSRTASTGHLGEGEEGADDTRPFLTPDSDRLRGVRGVGGKYAQQGSRSYLEVSRLDDTNSVSSEIIDL